MEYHGRGKITVAYFIPNVHIEFSVEWIWVVRFTFQCLVEKEKGLNVTAGTKLEREQEGLRTYVLSRSPKKGCSSKTRSEGWVLLGRSHGSSGGNLFCEETDDFLPWDCHSCNFLPAVNSTSKWQAKKRTIWIKLQMNGVPPASLGILWASHKGERILFLSPVATTVVCILAVSLMWIYNPKSQKKKKNQNSFTNMHISPSFQHTLF